MTQTLEEMTLAELKEEAKSAGVAVRGTKEDIIIRIKEKSVENLAITPTEDTIEIPHITKEILSEQLENIKEIVEEKENLNEEPITKLDDAALAAVQKEIAAYKETKILSLPNKTRALKIVDEVNEFFAGRAMAVYNAEDNPHCIEFHGGARRRQDVTIHQSIPQIMHWAATYVRRTDNQTGSIERAAPSWMTKDPSELSPEERKQAQVFIKQIMGE